MRKISALLIFSLLLACLSGCAPKRLYEPSISVPKKVSADIVLGTNYDIVSLDPTVSNDIYSYEICSILYDKLVALSENGDIIPSLAEHWDVSDGTEYIFYLRKDAVFHNGEKLTAEDVVFSLERAMESPVASSMFEYVTSVSALGEYTVKITTEKPYSSLLVNLSSNQSSILCKKAFDAETGEYTPIGTGPMMFKEYIPSDRTTLVRNENYWKGPCKTATLTRRVFPDEKSLADALSEGEIDYIWSVPAPYIEYFQNNPDFSVEKYISPSIAYMGFNMKKAPFDNILVRQAMHFSADKQKVVDSVYSGLGTVCTSVLPNTMADFNSELDLFNFSVKKGQSLMRSAGYPEGFDMEIIVTSGTRATMAASLADDFAALGINTKITVSDFADALNRMGQGDFDCFIMSWNGGSNYDLNMTANFHTHGSNNYMGYSSDEVDKLIETARQTFDEAQKSAIYKEIQKQIMVDSPWIPVYQQTTVSAMAKGVKGVKVYKTGHVIYTDMYIEEEE